MEDIIFYENYLIKVIEMIVRYELTQPIVFQKTKDGFVRITTDIPLDLLELQNNVLNKLRDSKIKYYSSW